METFKVEIRDYLSKIIEIEAESQEEAISQVQQSYKSGEIILSSDDYVTTEIDLITE